MTFVAYLIVTAGVVALALAVWVFQNLRPRDVPDPAVRAVLDRLGDLVAVYDAQGVVVRTNAGWVASGGAAGDQALAGFDPGDPVAEGMAECQTRRQPVGTLLCRWKGQVVTIGLTPLVDEFGDLLGGVMVVAPAPDYEALVAETGLTTREAQLLWPILQGRTYRQAGEVLGIGEATVKSHLQAVFRKTGCRSRHELSARFTPAS